MKSSFSFTKLGFSLIILFGFQSIQSQSVKNLIYTSSQDIPEANVPVISAEGINITTNNDHFKDASGRTLFLRGINLGGSTKVPYTPHMGSHVNEGFFIGKEVSFVGRPFPIEDADEHFRRLKAWGFDFLRFLVTWEAIEHKGPGIYDSEYLEYIREIIIKANEYGINVMIDPHQDVWSRYTGGDGAPLWTFEAAGMDVTKFQETGAAFVHNVYGDPFPQMIWYTNYFKLGASTMFTLFFGGNDFAPKTLIDGTPIQEYLQEHYINALLKVAHVVEDLPNVIGFELMNEPSAGYIGLENIAEPYNTDIMGDAPTAYQGILLGAGIPQSVKNYRLGAVALKETENNILNNNEVNIWKDPEKSIWRENGVWKLDQTNTPVLLDSVYFSVVNSEKVDFNTMYYIPFAKKYADAITKINPRWIICVDNVLFPYPHELPELKNIADINWVNGSHWYDDVTLIKKKYIPFLGLKDGNVVVGKRNVRRAFENTLSEMIKETHQKYGNVPSILGEFGIPFDMNQARAYKTGNFNKQNKALNRSFKVAEANLLNYTLWNYTADNTNIRGDLWNGEDLSVFSLSQQEKAEDINSGGRALESAIRPYPKKINGKLTHYEYNYKQKTLSVIFIANEESKYPNEIFVPEFIYANTFRVFTDSGKLTFDKKEHILMFYPENPGINHIVIKSETGR